MFSALFNIKMQTPRFKIQLTGAAVIITITSDEP